MPDDAPDPKAPNPHTVLDAARRIWPVIVLLAGTAGVAVPEAVTSGRERDQAQDARDAAIERATLRVRQDIDHGYNMCRQEWIERAEAGVADRVPKVPSQRIESVADEVVHDAVQQVVGPEAK